MDGQQAERSLAASETRYRRLFEAAKDGILILDADTGQIVDVNPFLTQLTGYSYDEFLGRHLWEIGPFQDAAASRESFSRLQREKYVRYEDLPLKARDGRTVDVEFVSNVYVEDHRNVIQCNIRDISARKIAERRAVEEGDTARNVAEIARNQLEEQRLATQQVQAIGTLAGGIAHDFNNMLTGMAGYIGMVKDQLTAHGLPADDLDGLERVRLRAAALTQKLLALARRQVIRRVPTDLNRVVRDFVAMAHGVLPEILAVEMDLAANLPTISADATQLDRVLLNLAVNARDAMPRGGVLGLSTRSVAPVGDATVGSVLLTVRDTGSGIPPELLGHIFEPFMTTKPVGKGTGLGLAVVQGIVAQHHGTVEVTSEPGRGTEFVVAFPVSKLAPVTAEPRQEPAGDVATGTETILLAEDDDDLRYVEDRVLRQAGYQVLTARDGEDALAVFREHAAEITLVVLDMVMPRMIGYEALQAMRVVTPGLPAVLVSGYSEKMLDERGAPMDNVTFLPKPFTNRKLLAIVRGTLDA